MRSVSASNELLLSDTSVPDLFIIQYMQDLSKDAVGLYLWLLMNGMKEFSKEEADKFGLISPKDVEEALVSLVSALLISRRDDGTYVFEDIKKREVDTYIKNRSQNTDHLEGTALNSDEKARNVLADSINKTFYQGNMPYLFYRLIDNCLYDYAFDSAVVYSLFKEGRDRRIHLKVNPMYKMAEEWNAKGYKKPEDLEKYFRAKNDIEKMTAVMGRLSRRRMNGVDIDYINKWVGEYGATPDLAEYAFKVNEWRGNITFKHVDDKLKEWYAAGVSSIDAAQVYEAERKTENQNRDRKIRGKNRYFRTGDEAGIKIDLKEEPDKKPKKKEDPVEQDDILDLFGSDDEDD